MIMSDKQVRSVHAVGAYQATVNDLANANDITISKGASGLMHGVLKVNNPLTNRLELISTDKLSVDKIRRITVSCPMGLQRSAFTITPNFNVIAKYPLLQLTIRFPEWFGVGVDNGYTKTMSFNAKEFIEEGGSISTAANKANLLVALKEMIELTFKYESYNPFDIYVDGSTSKLYIIERQQYFNPTNLIFDSTLAMDKAHYVDCGTAISHANDRKTVSETAWATVKQSNVNDVQKTVDALAGKPIANSNPSKNNIADKVIKDTNYRAMYELEHAGLKAGLDMGMGGWPNVQPSEMSGVLDAADANYYCLDIDYVYDRDMYEHPLQQKQMTFIAKTVTVLQSILDGMDLSAILGTTMKNGTTGAKDQTLAKAIESIDTMGSAWVAHNLHNTTKVTVTTQSPGK